MTLLDFIRRFFYPGGLETETEEERIQKTVVAVMAFATSLGGIVWGTIYFAVGLPKIALWPWGYVVLSILNIVVYLITRRYAILQNGQIALILIIPTGLQISLGGYAASGAVIIWAFLAPIVALMVSKRREVHYWGIAFFSFIFISGIIETTLSQTAAQMPIFVVNLFYIMNITAPLVTTYFITVYFINQREKMQAAIEEKSRELEATIISLQETSQALEVAQELERSKTEFLSNVSHELRTPLTSVLGFARIIQKELLNKIFPQVPVDDRKIKRAVRGVSEDLDIIIQEGERLTALINNVLDLSKIEAGRIEWNMQPLQYTDIIERAKAATTSLFAESNLNLSVQVDENLPAITGDQDRLIQVLINLISNAVKFTDEGNVTIYVRSSGDVIQTTIQDTGVGISSEDMATVFDRFRQVGNTLTDKPTGTGLGLPIAKEIIDHHGGAIWVESVLGEGSSFIFTLPISQSTAGSPSHVSLNDLIRSLNTHISTQQSNTEEEKTVLVVDDEAHIRTLLRKELEAKGYKVQEAADGSTAIQQTKQINPDIVILDIMMPDINGFDVVAALKQDPGTMNVPVIILSVIENRERGYKLGVDQYLVKPINMGLLFDAIENVLTGTTEGKVVVVADYDLETLGMIRNALAPHNHTIYEVNRKEALLETIRFRQPDMVIVKTDFVENGQSIRNDIEHADLSIIFYE